jgi:uncharacterized protein YprB with RNaseH-like and TPR domain
VDYRQQYLNCLAPMTLTMPHNAELPLGQIDLNLMHRTTDLVQRLQLARQALQLEAAVAKLDKFVVRKATEWPTRDFSIKTLAKYLGFRWRDTHPSGAASIEWFDRWISTRDPEIRQRILDYNEDDCRATRVLLDGIRALAGSVFAARTDRHIEGCRLS